MLQILIKHAPRDTVCFADEISLSLKLIPIYHSSLRVLDHLDIFTCIPRLRLDGLDVSEELPSLLELALRLDLGLFELEPDSHDLVLVDSEPLPFDLIKMLRLSDLAAENHLDELDDQDCTHEDFIEHKEFQEETLEGVWKSDRRVSRVEIKKDQETIIETVEVADRDSQKVDDGKGADGVVAHRFYTTAELHQELDR